MTGNKSKRNFMEVQVKATVDYLRLDVRLSMTGVLRFIFGTVDLRSSRRVILAPDNKGDA